MKNTLSNSHSNMTNGTVQNMILNLKILKLYLRDQKFEETIKTNEFGTQNVVCGYNWISHTY